MTNLSRLQFLSRQMICAGSRRARVGVTSGDAGAPLIVTKNSDMIQVGICGWRLLIDLLRPEAYTRVSKYRQFITNAVEKYGSDTPNYCP
jgi:secreted trypsin-like serine protease